jgi:hypothetical protein
MSLSESSTTSLSQSTTINVSLLKNLVFVVMSPLMEPPLWSHNGAAIDTDAHFKILLLHILQISQ